MVLQKAVSRFRALFWKSSNNILLCKELMPRTLLISVLRVVVTQADGFLNFDCGPSACLQSRELATVRASGI